MFQVPSVIQSLRSLADGTWRITIDCQEMPPEQELEVLKLKKKQGWFVFKENEIKEEDIPKEKAPEFKNDKTPSQRLRAVLYIYWKESTNQGKPFNIFYDEWMEKKITEIKEHLPEK